jgi:hypothetical protein
MMSGLDYDSFVDGSFSLKYPFFAVAMSRPISKCAVPTRPKNSWFPSFELATNRESYHDEPT